MRSLLERARQIPVKRQHNILDRVSPEELDLAIAYATHQITGSQLMAVMPRIKTRAGVDSWTGSVFRRALRAGLLVRGKDAPKPKASP
jgi:hypothetical protein